MAKNLNRERKFLSENFIQEETAFKTGSLFPRFANSLLHRNIIQEIINTARRSLEINGEFGQGPGNG